MKPSAANESRSSRRSPDQEKNSSSRGKDRDRDSPRRKMQPVSSATSETRRVVGLSIPVVVSPDQSPVDSGDDEETKSPADQEAAPEVLTDKEMNELNAKIFKAEMLGNEVRLALA
jgi:hypothetical protein